MKKTNPLFFRIVLFVGVLLLAGAQIATGFFTNLLNEIWGKDLKDPWVIVPIMAVVAVVAVVLGSFLPELYQRAFSRNNASNESPIDEDQYPKVFTQFKALLLEQYQLRLDGKTANRLPINLSARPSRYGTSAEYAKAFFEPKKLTIESDDIAVEIGKILDTHSRLLLVGDPGAGKTTILLFAAIHTLNEQKDPKLPLLLNLATWDGKRTFKDWYAQNVAHSYSLGAAFAQYLLDKNRIVPFFDGFDEIRAEHRESCFREMAAYFGDKRTRQLVVSSRKLEYAAAQADAPVYAELEVLPLSLPQIKQALSFNAQSQAADRALLQALERDPLLAKAVETPFYLNTASVLFGKGLRIWGDFHFKADTVAGRETELVEAFVGEQVPDATDRKHLAFLAGRMAVEDFLVFELIKVQPWWCGGRWKFGLIYGLIVGSIFGVVACLTYGFIVGLTLGLIVSLAFASIASLISIITSKEIQIWRWSSLKRKWKRGLVGGLVFGLVFGLTFGWIFGWVWVSTFDPTLVLAVVLPSSLVFGLVNGLINVGLDRYVLLDSSRPYQRFWATSKQFVWSLPAIFLTAVVSGLVTLYFEEAGYRKVFFQRILSFCWHFPFYTFLFLAAAVILYFLLSLFQAQFLEHFSLRLALYLEGKFPLRVVTFLDRMTDQYIFEDTRRVVKGKKQRGATWRFRHKILQDYLAGLGEVAPQSGVLLSGSEAPG